MAFQGGFGLTLQIDVGTVPTAVVDVLSADFPEQLKTIVRKVPHDASSGYAEQVDTGVKDLGAMTVRLGWDVDETTHAAILSAFDGTSAVDFSIADPSDDETIAFSGHVKSVKRISPAEDAFEADVVIQPTGAPTIT